VLKHVLGISLFSLLGLTSTETQDAMRDTLPDNHLPFTLLEVDHRLEGSSEYLEGFRLTVLIPDDPHAGSLDSAGLLSLVRSNEISGVLVYPNGRTTPIEFEVVDHRGQDDIYMKTTLGYFLWESFKVADDGITFTIDWWYCPPASEADLRILRMADSLLRDRSRWHQYDDRRCDDDAENGIWSLFCALKFASVAIMDEYNHHNTAMQFVRAVIQDMVPDNEFAHPLMDFNNAPGTRHSDILRLLAEAHNRMRRELELHDE
jgi:hypothetical protein